MVLNGLRMGVCESLWEFFPDDWEWGAHVFSGRDVGTDDILEPKARSYPPRTDRRIASDPKFNEQSPLSKMGRNKVEGVNFPLAKWTIIFSGWGDVLRILLGCQLSFNENSDDTLVPGPCTQWYCHYIIDPGCVTFDRGSLRFHVPLMVCITQLFGFLLNPMPNVMLHIWVTVI